MSGRNYLAEPINVADPVVRESDLLAAPTEYPDTPRTIWLELPGYVLRISAPASGIASVMNDDYLMYDNQTMVD